MIRKDRFFPLNNNLFHTCLFILEKSKLPGGRISIRGLFGVTLVIQRARALIFVLSCTVGSEKFLSGWKEKCVVCSSHLQKRKIVAGVGERC